MIHDIARALRPDFNQLSSKHSNFTSSPTQEEILRDAHAAIRAYERDLRDRRMVIVTEEVMEDYEYLVKKYNENKPTVERHRILGKL